MEVPDERDLTKHMSLMNMQLFEYDPSVKRMMGEESVE